MSSVDLINNYKCTSLVQDAGKWGRLRMCESRDIQELPGFSAQIALNLKLL
jgi:hypothetical protein